MKTVQDYMNDPRILNDPGLMAAPEIVSYAAHSSLKQARRGPDRGVTALSSVRRAVFRAV
jgi:hypothetical protein